MKFIKLLMGIFVMAALMLIVAITIPSRPLKITSLDEIVEIEAEGVRILTKRGYLWDRHRKLKWDGAILLNYNYPDLGFMDVKKIKRYDEMKNMVAVLLTSKEDFKKSLESMKPFLSENFIDHLGLWLVQVERDKNIGSMEVYLNTQTNQEVKDIIRCSTRGRNSQCTHSFIYNDNFVVTMTYSKKLLLQYWKNIKQNVNLILTTRNNP